MSDINPDDIAPHQVVNPLKLRDIDSLLKKHFGEDWNENLKLSYYSSAINITSGYIVHEDNPESENEDPYENAFV